VAVDPPEHHPEHHPEDPELAEAARASVSTHRELVLLRLMLSGVSVETLVRLFPDWAPLITRLQRRSAPDPGGQP
jgi:hypothetical protein